MTYRKLQVESTLKRTISQILSRRMSDPRINGILSVTHVDVSPDGRNATVHVSVIPEKFEKRALYGLRHAAGYVQSLVRKAVAMRAVPHLDFKLDQSLKKQAAVFEAIDQGLAQDAAVVSNPPAAASSLGSHGYGDDSEEPDR